MTNSERAKAWRQRRKERAERLWSVALFSLHDAPCPYPDKPCRCKPVVLIVDPKDAEA